MKGLAALMSTAARPEQNPQSRDDWRTPEAIIWRAVKTLGGLLDPCASADPAQHFAAWNWSGPDGNGCDGLALDWDAPVFLNFPYSEATLWAAKYAREIDAGRCPASIVIMPARMTRAWHQIADRADVLCLPRSRVRFIADPEPGAKPQTSPPFPSSLLYRGPEPERFVEHFGDLGRCWRPREASGG